MRLLGLCAIFVTLSVYAAGVAVAGPRADLIPGPITGTVTEIYDGDTVTVRLKVWIGQEIEASVRINGMDAPEIKGKCTYERNRAQDAKAEVTHLLSDGTVTLYNIRLEKYAGRVLATAITSNGIDIAKYMVDKGLARAYHGKHRDGWCS